MAQPIEFEKWLSLVKFYLIKNGWIKAQTVLDRKSWKQLYDDGLTAGRAVVVNMECEGLFCVNK